VADALANLQAEVKDNPSDPKLRIFLFQLLAITAQWDRALNQLNVLQDLDVASLPMVHAYREALQCEVFREEVFKGRRSPLIFGEPEPWIARMVEALRVGADGKHEEASQLREAALESAETSDGTIDGKDFQWIADADPRLGPLLEVVINGKYYWVPFRRIRSIRMEPPEDLRDLVWMPAQITWANSGEAVGLIPSRYPGVTADDDSQILLARKTDWDSPNPDAYFGQGQRLLVTDLDEYPLLETREILLTNEEAGEDPNGG
jgi:type VI secretion system protein ImpE